MYTWFKSYINVFDGQDKLIKRFNLVIKVAKINKQFEYLVMLAFDNHNDLYVTVKITEYRNYFDNYVYFNLGAKE